METILTKHLSRYFKAQYDKEIETFEIQPTKAQFEGDLTVVVFPLLRIMSGHDHKLPPDERLEYAMCLGHGFGHVTNPCTRYEL